MVTTTCLCLAADVIESPSLWCLLMLGTLLPDIDSKKSILGRFFHLPVKHRTWTHSIWPLIPLYFLGSFVPQLFFLFM